MFDKGESSLNVITRVTLSGLSPEHPIVIPPEGEIPPEGGDAHPSHPIYYPDAHPEHPIAGGGGPRPSHPIAPGGEEPAHPIVIPPGGELPPEVDGEAKFEVKVGWTEDTGWVVVLVPTGEHVTPSKR